MISPELVRSVASLAAEVKAQEKAAQKAAAEERAAQQRAAEQAAAEQEVAQRKADEQAAIERAEAQRKADERVANAYLDAQRQHAARLAAQQDYAHSALAYGIATGARVLTQPHGNPGQSFSSGLDVYRNFCMPSQPQQFFHPGHQPRPPTEMGMHPQPMRFASAPQQGQPALGPGQHFMQPPMGYPSGPAVPQQAVMQQLGYYFTPQAMASLGAQQNAVGWRPHSQNVMPFSSQQLLQSQQNPQQPPSASARPQLSDVSPANQNYGSAERTRKCSDIENTAPAQVIANAVSREGRLLNITDAEHSICPFSMEESVDFRASLGRQHFPSPPRKTIHPNHSYFWTLPKDL